MSLGVASLIMIILIGYDRYNVIVKVQKNYLELFHSWTSDACIPFDWVLLHMHRA